MSAYLDTNQNMTSTSFNTGNATGGNSSFNTGITSNLLCSAATIPNVFHDNLTAGALVVSGECIINNIVYTGTSTGTLVINDDFIRRPAVGYGYVQTVKFKEGIADNVSATICTITTGANEGGGYSVKIWGNAGHALVSASTNTAAMYFDAQFSRSMISSGTGVTSTVTQSSETSAATSSGIRDISSVAITVSEISEYQVDVLIQIDLSGSSIDTWYAMTDIELIYHGFITEPTVS